MRILLTQWDPIGITGDGLECPEDEYDCLIGPLLARLNRGAGRAEIRRFLRHELADHFGIGACGHGTGAFTDLLLAWYATWPPAGSSTARRRGRHERTGRVTSM